MLQSIAQVVVGLPIPGPFDYSIPEELWGKISIGSRVYVPFRAHYCVGYVVGLMKSSRILRSKIKPIANVLDSSPTLDVNFLKLTNEISKRYLCSWGEAIEVALPVILRSRKEISWTPPIHKTEIDGSAQLAWIQGSIHSAAQSVAQKVQDVFSSGRGIIFLVPEIGQVEVVKEFLAKVCQMPVTDLDRGFGVKRSIQEWLSVKEGHLQVVVGTRSAVFAMMPSVGLIVVLDEENQAYKQEPSPFYHARQVALLRHKSEKCDVVFVTPAPTVELWKILKEQKATVEICREKTTADLQVIDMANYKYQNMLVSFPLQNFILETLVSQGKVFLFLNRRGFSTMTKCNHCGFVLKCERCNTTLGYSFTKKKMMCFRCHFSAELPKMCPSCQGSYLRSTGSGIEKLESELSRIYPQARVAIFDSGSKVFPKDANILIATQAVMPYLRRSEYALIAVLNYDGEINRPDFRASVRALSLLIKLRQAAGKKLLVQTRNPQHEALLAARTMDIKKFYQHELNLRKALRLPPSIHMVELALRGPREEMVLKQAQHLYDRLQQNAGHFLEISVPQPDLTPKLRDKYRFTIMLKGKALKKMVRFIEPLRREFGKGKDIILTVDVEP